MPLTPVPELPSPECRVLGFTIWGAARTLSGSRFRVRGIGVGRGPLQAKRKRQG